MEKEEGFASVMDHGVDVSVEHLPKIPCSKFTMIGNSRMRNKKPVMKKEQMWKVPKGFRRPSDRELLKSEDNQQDLKVNTKSMDRKFGNQEELNRFDKHGIYGDAFQRTLDLTTSGGNRTASNRQEPKVEKKLITEFYRDRSSLFLPHFSNRYSADSGSSCHATPLLCNSDTQGAGSCGVAKSCEGNARHYCDIVGQRYCTSCLRQHRLEKLTHRSDGGRKSRHRVTKTKSVKTLPKIRTGANLEKGVKWPDESSDSGNLRRTTSSPPLAQREPHVPPFREKLDLSVKPKLYESRKRRKVVSKPSIISNGPKLPVMSDITTDTDSRYLLNS